MFTQTLKPVIAVSMLALLSACAATETRTSTLPSVLNSGQAAVQSATKIGAANVGDTVELSAGNPTGASRADVVAEYQAASNRLCRQVLPSGTSGMRLVCAKPDGSWEWIRSLKKTSAAMPLPAVAVIGAATPHDAVFASDASPELVHEEFEAVLVKSNLADYTVRDGETLWKFSRRTTGSGTHWRAIAELNSIDDARTIETGMMLQVPPSLARGH